MSVTPILFVLLILAMSAVLIVLFFVMPFFAFDLDEEIKARRPQSRMRTGRSVKQTRKKSQIF
jgi:hypothetical protein